MLSHLAYLGYLVLLEQVRLLIYFSVPFCILIVTKGNYKMFERKDFQIPLCHERMEAESENTDFFPFFFFSSKNTQAKLPAAII